MPMTAFIGVRISWLIVARKELLASFAASAAARACLVSLNIRTFWIAITAWSAKVSTRAISAASNGRTSVAEQRNHAERLALAQQRHVQRGAETAMTLLDRRGRRDTRFRALAAHPRRGSTAVRAARVRQSMSCARGNTSTRHVGGVRRSVARHGAQVGRRPCSQTRLPSARQSSPARCATASSTGCTSVGDSLMTPRTSAVAVCRSSATFVSLKRRTFSSAITAWSTNDFASAISLSVKALALARVKISTPRHSLSRKSGSISDDLTPNRSAACRSCSESLTADQSGMCSIFFSTITREGRLAPGSIGSPTGIGPAGRPWGVATATVE